ncbi:HNH endonuclease signature motif containing protein [Mycolicibacterium vaccae]|uniref:HNH endonuclease signature motif containing protein n=1 Tax=Mycolicibacterium vaccae TaxID=1810 RepID=UPI003CF4288F
MSGATGVLEQQASPQQRLEELFDELAELSGQRNAIDGRLVEIIAELDRAQLWGMTGCRSAASMVAWKLGITPRNAETMVAVAERIDEFPACNQALREGRLSLDRVGVIAEGAADGSDEHYVEYAQSATVTQLRTAVKLEPRPTPKPRPERGSAISKSVGTDGYTTWHIRLSSIESAKFDTALASHKDGLVADWKHHHDTPDTASDGAPPFPNNVDAFNSLVEAGWDAEVARRPHGQHTTVIVHLDLKDHLASLHLGPLLPEDDRQYLTCDATAEVWFHRDGQPLGAGRTTRTIGRRLRRALEHRDRTCVVPGCGATRGLHAHHLIHWEHGGPTDLTNLVLVCPYHHRAHHNGALTLTGPADHLTVTDPDGDPLTGAALSRPPTQEPPQVPPCPGPTGERADWWWYTPYQPKAPPNTN